MVGFKDRIASDVTQESVGAVRGVCKACKLMFASIVIIKLARTWRGVQTMHSTSHNTNVSIAEFLQSMSVRKEMMSWAYQVRAVRAAAASRRNNYDP